MIRCIPTAKDGISCLGYVMRKFLYALEDHFDALADDRQGYVSGSLSRWIGKIFAVAGDVLQVGLRSGKS